jgi:hypothetical protein
MQFATLAILVFTSLATATPLAVRNDGGDIAACETAVASQQVACITGCGSNSACINAWSVHLHPPPPPQIETPCWQLGALANNSAVPPNLSLSMSLAPRNDRQLVCETSAKNRRSVLRNLGDSEVAWEIINVNGRILIFG